MIDTSIIIASLIIAVSATVQGITGFGFSLVAFPLLAILLPVNVITPILVLCSLITNIMILRSVQGVTAKGIKMMSLIAILATPFGAYLLKVVSPEILKAAVGIILSGTSLFMLKGYRIKFRRELLAKGITGFFSGLLNGTLSMSGPPIILYLSNQGAAKDNVRGSFSLFALITNIFAIATLIYTNIITMPVFMQFATLIPALIIGVYAGILISKRVNEVQFKQITLYLLLIMGISTIISSAVYIFTQL